MADALPAPALNAYSDGPTSPNGGTHEAKANVHKLVSFETKIKAGGTVNFIIGGFHLVTVYGPGTDFDDISTKQSWKPVLRIGGLTRAVEHDLQQLQVEPAAELVADLADVRDLDEPQLLVQPQADARCPP